MFVERAYGLVKAVVAICVGIGGSMEFPPARLEKRRGCGANG